MKTRIRGLSRAIWVLGAVAALCGCAGALSQREAVQIANARMTKYCHGSASCNGMKVTQAQKIKDRWLVQFDSAARNYGVLVDDGGNTQISIWDKGSVPPGR